MRSYFVPVGTRVKLDGETYEAVEQLENTDYCMDCDFYDGKLICKSPYNSPVCIRHFRKDGKSIIFKKIK